MTSSGGNHVWPTYGAVSAAKAALEAHVRQLAYELATYGITANCIRAGVTETPALRKIPGNDRLIESALAKNPHRPLTTPVDVAAAIAALCTEGTHWISGNIIGVDGDENRLAMARRMGADVVLDYRQVDVVAEVNRLTDGGVDVAIEALGTQQTFESALRCLRPGGTLSSLGVYSGKLQVPYDAFTAGIGDYRIVTTLCPGGKERMRQLLSIVQSRRFDPTLLLTHSFSLEDIAEGYRVFDQRLDGVMKVAIRP